MTKQALKHFALLTLLVCATAYAQLTPAGDTYTNTAGSTTNYGAKTLLDVDGATQITYIQFNLASIPVTASISQATLKLYVNTVTAAGSFNVDYVNGAWAESTIDASNAPALGAAIASDVAITTADKNQYILIDVTAAVQAWLSGSEANNGIALVANSKFNATFDSKENTTTSHPPELDIAFAGGDGTITGVTTPSGSGLTGGGTSGTLNLALTNACAANQVLQWNGSSWTCAAVGTGTITGVTAGTDLTGGGTSGNVTLSLNTTALNSVYPQLAANNTFSGTQTINNLVSVTGASSSGALSALNTLTSGSAPGVVGMTNSTNASGVKGVATTTGGSSNGVFGTTSSAGGYGVLGSGPFVGVYGSTSGSLSTDYGVQGVATGNGVGVAGTGNTISGEGGALGNLAGVWGDTNLSGTTFAAGVAGTADNASAGKFFNDSNSYPTLELQNDGSGGLDATVLVAQGQSGVCSMNAGGDLNCTGKMVTAASVNGGASKVALYSMQSPENWFEDFGSGNLRNGVATIALDAQFAQTVNVAAGYHVFITPNGDCKGLYVSNKTGVGFEVRELGGGISTVSFDYRIVAKRAGYENVRFADLTKQFNKQEEQHQKTLHSARSSSAAKIEPAAAPRELRKR